jgi:hypothetical protein
MVRENVRVLHEFKRFITTFAILALLSLMFAPATLAIESSTDGSDKTAFAGLNSTIILNGAPSSGASVGVAVESIGSALSPYSGLARTMTVDPNDDPNYAYWLDPNTGYQQSLSPQGASRWFATEIDAAAKLTTLLDMPSNVDFDLGIYKLNGSSLTYVASSAAGTGIREVSKYMATAGTYYIRVLSYSGTGTFQLYNFVAYGYDGYEMNDTAATATVLPSFETYISGTVTGNIDSHYDEDYYQITVPASGTTYLIPLLTTENPNHQIYYNNTLLQQGVPFVAPASTFPIRVLSIDHSFDEDVPYTLAIQKLPASYDPSLALLITTPNNSVTVQYNEDATDEMYVNGHQINWWFEDFILFPNNSAGYIMRRVNFDTKGAVGAGSPPPVQPGIAPYNTHAPVYYTSTHRGATNETMFMIRVNNCRVTNSSVGYYAYDNISTSNTVDSALVIVNPASGAIFDVLSPNVIYEYSGGTVDAQEMTPHWYFPPSS